ncbi:MAG: acyl-CoA dehydrogenase family protein [Acidimicrobiales bacterium]
MYLRYTEDEVVVDEMFDSFFSSVCSIEQVRSSATLGFDPDAWRRLIETGAPSMSVPIELGGGGANLATLAIAATHLGRTIAAVPLIEHVVALRLLASVAPESPLLDSLLAGDRIASLALRPGLDEQLVPAGAIAEVIVGFVGESIVVSQAEPPLAALPNLADLPIARRSLAESSAIGGTQDHYHRALAEWQALMAVALAGLGRAALRLGVDYVTEREQFGVPIGSFQAIQHGLADVATAVEGADMLAQRAVWALDSDQGDALSLASMAMLFAGETAQRTSAAALQYHGGYGFAEEYDIQLFYRRAKGWPLQFGSSSSEYQRLADLVLGEQVA